MGREIREGDQSPVSPLSFESGEFGRVTYSALSTEIGRVFVKTDSPYEGENPEDCMFIFLDTGKVYPVSSSDRAVRLEPGYRIIIEV